MAPRFPFAHYVDLVEAVLAAGITSKSARKNANDLCACAFDCAREIVKKDLLADRTIPNWDALYWGFPDCHNWRLKHGDLFQARWPEAVAQANACAELRARIKAAPLVEKPKRQPTKRELDKAAKAMTCQICGRAIFAELGRIAHHGYERPGHGWQTASCYGALRLPYEVSRDAIMEIIPRLQADIARMREALRAVTLEHSPVTAYARKRALNDRFKFVEVSFSVTRETLPFALYFAPSAFEGPRMTFRHNGGLRPDGTWTTYDGRECDVWEVLKTADLASRALRIENVQAMLAEMKRRRDAWKLTYTWDAGAKKWRLATDA